MDFLRGPATGLGQPQASTSGRPAVRRATAVQCSYGGLQRPPPRRPSEPPRPGSGAGAAAPPSPVPPSPAPAGAQPAPPRQLNLGYTGPRLASRPELGSAGARRALEMVGRRPPVVFEDNDARMAVFDAMEVNVTCNDEASAAAAAEGDAAADANSTITSSSGSDSSSSGAGSSSSGGGFDWSSEDWRLRSFNDLRGRAPYHLLQRIKAARLNRPTPLQGAAIPVLLSGRDLLLAAPPGSGATAAYLIPLLQGLERTKRMRTVKRALPPGLVLAPSRELAQQVAAEASRLSQGGKVKVLCATGGTDLATQKLALRGGCDLLVATPGRLLALIANKAAGLQNLRWLVLEESDALLFPGNDSELRELVSLHLPLGGFSSGRGGLAGLAAPAAAAVAAAADGSGNGAEPGRAPLQTVLVTTPAADLAMLRTAASDFLRPGAVTVTGAMPGGAGATPAAPAARQRVVGVAGKLKARALLRLLSDGGAASDGGSSVTGTGAAGGGGGALVCCASAESADRAAAALEAANVACGVLHAGRSQLQRDEALQCFRFGVTRVLVACGVAARGLDLPDVTQVINYDPPGDEAEYAKRLARLGRGAGALGAAGGGEAVTLVCPEDAPRAAVLVRALAAAGAAAPDWLSEMAEQHEQAAAAATAGRRDSDGSGGVHGQEARAGGRLFSVRRQPVAGARFGSYLPLGPQGGGSSTGSEGA